MANRGIMLPGRYEKKKLNGLLNAEKKAQPDSFSFKSRLVRSRQLGKAVDNVKIFSSSLARSPYTHMAGKNANFSLFFHTPEFMPIKP